MVIVLKNMGLYALEKYLNIIFSLSFYVIKDEVEFVLKMDIN